MKTITRKTMLYKTGVEYGDYTMNYVLGCTHGCKYPCYAFMLKKRFGVVKSYEEWCRPALVSNTLEILDKEIPKLKDEIKSVHLCFTTDPFMYGEPEVADMSIMVIDRLNQAGITCTVLTKGILPDGLAFKARENSYGITVVSLSEEFREKMEPGSAPILERINALRTLHDLGAHCWVSIEPYPTPNIIQQDLAEILDTIGFVDRIIFGRLNYSKAVTAYPDYKAFYNEQAQLVMSFCRNHNLSCHIKKGTVS